MPYAMSPPCTILEVASAIHRTKAVAELDRNAKTRSARMSSLNTLTYDIAASLAHRWPGFDRDRFLSDSGMSHLA